MDTRDWSRLVIVTGFLSLIVLLLFAGFASNDLKKAVGVSNYGNAEIAQLKADRIISITKFCIDKNYSLYDYRSCNTGYLNCNTNYIILKDYQYIIRCASANDIHTYTTEIKDNHIWIVNEGLPIWN